jgi:multicomponent Na+:H+ antiporter subunit G
MISGAATILLLLGSLFMLIGAIGIYRFPDFYTRMHAATKATSLGMGLLLAGAAVHFGNWIVLVKAFLVMAFIFLTTPVAAHAISQAAYRMGVDKWPGTKIDEMDNPASAAGENTDGEHSPTPSA